MKILSLLKQKFIECSVVLDEKVNEHCCSLICAKICRFPKVFIEIKFALM